MPPALNVPPEPSNDAPLRERMRAWSSGRRMMDLVSFSEEGAIHDWNYLLCWWMATAKKPANG